MIIPNQSAFDVFSLEHAASGFIARKAGVKLELVMLGAVAWEFAEDKLKERYPDAFPDASPDSKANALGDILSALLGYWLGGL